MSASMENQTLIIENVRFLEKCYSEPLIFPREKQWFAQDAKSVRPMVMKRRRTLSKRPAGAAFEMLALAAARGAVANDLKSRRS